jgi:fatty acid desaturase
MGAGKVKRGEEFKDDFRKALPPELVQRLSRISPWRSAWSVLQEFLAIGALVAAALHSWTWWTVVPCVILIGTRQHALFVLAHEAAHYRLFEGRGLNDLAGRLCATLQGLSMRTYRVIHRLHHNNLYTELDPDTALHGGYPRGKAYLVKKLLKDLTGFTAWKTYAYFLGGAPALNTQTNLVPAWLGWLIFPHHVNYHIEHHLYASVPHYNLPELHRELASRGLLAGAEVVPFNATLEKIFSDRVHSAA